MISYSSIKLFYVIPAMTQPSKSNTYIITLTKYNIKNLCNTCNDAPRA